MKKATLAIDGIEYTLSYDFNRICMAESAAGCNLLEALGNLLSMSAVQLLGLLYAMIERDGKRVSREQVGALVRIDTIPAIEQALAEALRLSLPAKSEPPAGAAES